MIRKALITDVAQIHKIVNEFARQEQMLPLSIGDITERIRDFHVHEEDGRLIGCIALHYTWDLLCEVRSLAVLKEAQGTGLGKRLMDAALDEARYMGATEVFTLTYVPDFFRKFGFEDIDRADLPHKVWLDCIKCSKFPECGEIALKLTL